MRAQLGDEVLERILAAYLAELPRYLGELRTALDQGDAPLAQRAAHSLKGASQLIGAEPLGAACERVEHAAKGGHLAGIGGDVELVTRLAATTEAAVKGQMPG
jgi:HPt (histidine-containing phosphotransfer) domain-containing protein